MDAVGMLAVAGGAETSVCTAGAANSTGHGQSATA